MTVAESQYNDEGLEWLFSRARAFHLLDRDEEQHFDRRKWHSIEALCRLLSQDERGRHYLSRWAHNLLSNPPDLVRFSEKRHYYLLRREQAHYSKDAGAKAILSLLAKGNFSSSSDVFNCADFELDSVLWVSFAEFLLGRPEASGLTAALTYWHQFWPEPPLQDAPDMQPDVASAMASEIRNYYAARNALVNHNLRLVFSVANKLKGRQAYRDLIQDGVTGLIRAAEKFRYDKGFRFSTYAFNWIMQACRRSNDEMAEVVRFPGHIKEQLTAVQRERHQFLAEHGRMPGRTSLAGKLDINRDELEDLIVLDNRALSTETQIGGQDSALSLGDTLPDAGGLAPEYDAAQASLSRLLMERLEQLKPQEQQVVIRRWGLDQLPAATRKELARQMNVSPEWIRQLEIKALNQLGNDSVLQAVERDYRDN